MLFNHILLVILTVCKTIISFELSSRQTDQKNIFYSDGIIDRFIVSRDQNTIYIGSTNRLTSISSTNFSIVNEILLGPVRDSPWCNTDGKSCLKDNRPSLTDVHTKILHSLPSNQLLHCGSVKLGSCAIYNSNLVLVTESNVPVAANSPEASTVSQIIDNRLVVAATATEESPYRDPFPSVSIRELHGLNVENAGDLNGEAAVYLRAYYKGHIRFVAIFAHENFIFVVASVREARLPVTTKMIRFCKNDTKFVSYSEIELQCRGEDNTNHPFLNTLVQDGDKIIASFSISTDSAQSSICVFSMQKVKLTFWYNLDRCRSGVDSIKLPHIGRDTKCLNKAHIPLDENSCELGVGGSIELAEISVKTVFERVTSLMSVDQKVIFAGTDSSQIVMLKWKNSSNSITLEEYGRRKVGNEKTGNEVQQMVRYGDNVLIQLKYGIIMEELSICTNHNSCTECLLSVDPLCQWCHPTQSCTISSRCVGQVTLQCPIVDAYPTPSRISVNTTTDIFFAIRDLPPPVGFTYRCQFDSKLVGANWNPFGLSCPTEKFRYSKVMQVSLMTSASRNPLSRHNVTVFDCSDYGTCSQCMASNYGCHWCSQSHECSYSCNQGAVRACIKIQPLKLPIAIGSLQEIVMEATNLDTLDKNKAYYCKAVDQIAPALLAFDSFRCGKIRLMSESENKKDMVIPLSLMTEDVVLDVANVSLYSCSKLASDCSSCLALQPSLSCGWCNRKCLHDCGEIKESTLCDPPRIDKFEPSSGPIEGGTIIKIYGSDLGMSLEDVQGKVYVAGSRCDIIEYHVSNMIACRVEKGMSSGPIRISVGRVNMTVVESQEMFSFVRVSIFSAYPLYGPISGGTKIVLYGQNLLSGSTINVTIGDEPCLIGHNKSTSALSCSTPAGTTVGKSAKIIVRIDYSEVQLNQPFEYRSDPEISSVFPITTFKAGGKILSIEGSSLNTVQSAQIYFVSSTSHPFEIISELAPCYIMNSTRMTCTSPRVLETVTRKVEYTRHSVGFLMDNVTAVRNIGRRIQMIIYPNPIISPFKGKWYHQGEQHLILKGNNLNLAAGPNDFKVYIGSERCYVTLVDIKQLVCSGPSKQPEATDEKGTPINGNSPLVTVFTGSLRMEIGLIEYANLGKPSRLSLLILSLCLFIVITMIATFLLFKRKRCEREEYDKMRIQMDNLAKNVRKECKQAFAELQTNLALSPKPIEQSTQTEVIDFPRFVENLLWAENMLTTTSLAQTLPVALAQFHALLSFKELIFTIVDVAESNNSIPTSEKAMLASLLISVLLRNFCYCTEIVIDLLRAHIAKTVHKKQTELLFRNSDSLVEMMFSKWMCICLYTHLTPQMNYFYNLYKALQYQTDKGPVDAVTGDARYTINEAKLLRECVEAKTLVVNVIPLETSHGIVRLEVHSCDAINQVKQKVASSVYHDTPYSQRLRITNFDLRLKCPRQGEVKLNEFQTFPEKKLPVKLLTLADYAVQDESILEMTPAIYTSGSYRHSLVDSGKSSWASLDSFLPIYSPSKYYHLTKATTGSIMFKTKSSSEIPKSIPEVYLTRLITSKGTVEAFIEDFLESVLYIHDSEFPPILKFVFDLLDQEAAINGVSENICQQWKANGFVLRVWANFIKSPHLALDLPHSISMDANLSTIAQTMMDCFSFSDPILSAQSPSSRLLFAKDVARLRPFSLDLFERIKNCPLLRMEELKTELISTSNDLSTCKGSSLALSELMSWVRGNGIQITQCLSSREEAVQQRLPQKLANVLHVCLETDNHIYSTISDCEP